MTAHSKPICPLMGVQTRDVGDGYHPTVTWTPCKCRRDGCALWSDYGCGLSHNITTDYQALCASTTPTTEEENDE